MPVGVFQAGRASRAFLSDAEKRAEGVTDLQQARKLVGASNEYTDDYDAVRDDAIARMKAAVHERNNKVEFFPKHKPDTLEEHVARSERR